MDSIRCLSRRIGGLLVLSLGLSASAVAGNLPPPDGPDAMPMQHERVKHPPEASGFPPAFTPPFIDGLSPSEEQLDKMFMVRHEFALAIHEKRRQLEKATQVLHELSFAEKFDETKARESAANAASAMAELSLLQARQDARLFAILTPAQRAAWAERKLMREEFPRPQHDPGKR